MLRAILNGDAELIVIRPDWTRTMAGTCYAGRMYELWATTPRPVELRELGVVVGRPECGINEHTDGHAADGFTGDARPRTTTREGHREDHNWVAQATSIPLSHTIISRRDIMRGLIDHPFHFMLNVADGTWPQTGPVWPAQRYDGGSVTVCRQGFRFRLPHDWVIDPSHPSIIPGPRARRDAVRPRVHDTVTGTGPTFRMEPGAKNSCRVGRASAR